MNAERFESEVEDVVDGIVNEIATSGLPAPAILQRLAERHGFDLAPLAPELDAD